MTFQFCADSTIPEGYDCLLCLQYGFSDGGLVPKTHYLPEESDMESGIDSLSVSSESLYQTVSLAKENYHEVKKCT